MPNVTLGELKQRGKLRADMSGSRFISDDELTEYANASLAELYDILVKSFEDHIDPVIYEITTASGTESYDMPADLYKIRKVRVINGTLNAWLERGSLDEIGTDSAHYTGRFNEMRYYPLGSKLYLTPTPSGNETIQIWYIPVHQYVKEDAAPIHYAIPVGWTEYAVLGIAIRCLTKEQTDTSGLLQEREIQRLRITTAAQNRDYGEADQVVDKTGRFQRRSRWW